MEYEVARPTRKCAATGRELHEGETCYSVLVSEGARYRRVDYAPEAWNGPPEKAVGWWRSKVPSKAPPRPKWAPHDVLLNLFLSMEGRPAEGDRRYVLALLLIRRRIVRLEETQVDAQGRETLVVYCPREDATFKVPVTNPSAERIHEIDGELAALLTTA